MSFPRDDDRLLDALGEALRPTVPSAEPTLPETVAFRRLVADYAPGAGGGRHRTWVRVLSVAAAAALLLGGLLVNAGSDNGPTRLDVAEAQFDDLRSALASGDRVAIEREADETEAALRELTPAEQAAVASEASALLAEADRVLGPTATTVAPTPAATTTVPPTTTTTAAPAVVPPATSAPPTPPTTEDEDHSGPGGDPDEDDDRIEESEAEPEDEPED